MKRWVILVSQVVRGKSRAPERNGKGPKWKRHKPYRYSNSWKDHEILYSKLFTATEEDARAEAERISAAMFDTYLMGMGKTDHYCVQEFKVVLHDASDDVAYDVDGTIKAKEGQLWHDKSDSFVSNRTLRRWNVIPYNPSDVYYKVLAAKQRTVK